MSGSHQPRAIVGITGASGALYPTRTLAALMERGYQVLCAEAGVLVMPAMPAFYEGPRTTIDDLADFMAGKILAALGVEHDLYLAWTG